MKKTLATLLALMMALTLCGCGEGADSEKPKDAELTAETLAGNYSSRLWFMDSSITFNENTTYEFGENDNAKGTFAFNGETILLDPVYSDYYGSAKAFTVNDGSVYVSDFDWCFEEDEDYGLGFSPDENGLTDQSFESCILNTKLPGCAYNWVFLDLNADGTFTLKVGQRGFSSLDVGEIFDGTYTSNDSALILTYDGRDYPLIIDDSNQIFYVIYDRV